MSRTNLSFHFLLLIQFKVAGSGGGGDGGGRLAEPCRAAVTNTFKLNSITVMPSPLTLLHSQPSRLMSLIYKTQVTGERDRRAGRS